MPVIVSEDGERPGGRLTVVPISHISTDVNHDHHSVTGRLVHKGPLVSSSIYDFILKAAIEEGNSSPQETSSINLVLLGALASDFSQFVNQGDVVTASGFLVSKSPTAQKDKRHACNLLLSGDQAFIHVLRSPPHDLTSPGQAKRKKRFPPAAVASPTKSTYVRIAELKPGAVVNVYGVVVFFKQPFKSRGSDFCYSLKITDQSQQNIVCTIFCPKLELLPQIFRIGDIVRLHRVKTKMYKDSLNLVNWFGFSALTFNGTVGAEMNPRTSSKTFHFTEEDRRIVTELRSWVAGRDLLPPDLTVPLSAAKPGMYFNLTCQLLAKAPVNITCTLLRVWDGTRCPHALLEVTVDADVVEGPRSFPEEHEKLIANVLVFDNHVQSVQQLKPGDFLRIFNLRAIAGCVKVPGLTSSQVGVLNHLSFHLHGGTAYGRGVRLLPDDSPEVQELKRLTEAVQDDTNINDSALWDVWKTPPETPEREASAEFRTENSCRHDVDRVTLCELRRRRPAGFHHVRARVQSYRPRRLYQALKLYCSKCTSMLEVPDDKRVASVFCEASADPRGPRRPPPWSLSGQVRLPDDLAADEPGRALDVHVSAQLTSEGKTKELLFLGGSTLQEARHLAATYRNVVPVRSSPGGHLAPLDLSAPFIFRGRKSFYGCKRCSKVAAITEPTADGDKTIDEKIIAEAFGIHLLKWVLVLEFRLQDAGGTLDAYLWRDAESFFNVLAEDAAADQEAQDRIQRTMDWICPPEGSAGERPWLDLCLAAYQTEDGENGKEQTSYQICHTSAPSHQHLQL
ncbi:protection of telomeres protein 1 isoform X2 [Syngnathoides biaculeatus]|nr:protection of telomeres protein 1 isoform X2 [Syngnathoides biaculeatus]XP_061697214.1 protection of telomeres protein 1 isoform X2 [Syngnathoides biaculeatus]XP_061697215.1 protection of telomeres protein 1 isoform X2 [Syngnathoides biaculeatus]XP_061697216.1 protection of telomeres protein 1 isoform X2 [Syngnathoides biaculeatus]XP_061697217.1 protection of telomeres protein 1 isoform X2 [Syngnathoides biaculeatus]XP_061697218.1 protection of telomeres protein 1 isoform X2 [Syngnathoides 